jgi:hypothetical protein
VLAHTNFFNHHHILGSATTHLLSTVFNSTSQFSTAALILGYFFIAALNISFSLTFQESNASFHFGCFINIICIISALFAFGCAIGAETTPLGGVFVALGFTTNGFTGLLISTCFISGLIAQAFTRFIIEFHCCGFNRD